MGHIDRFTSCDRVREIPTGARRKATRTGFFRKPNEGQLATKDGLAFNNDCVVQSLARLTGWDFEQTARKLLAARQWHPYIGGNLDASIRSLKLDVKLVNLRIDQLNPEGRYLLRGALSGHKNGHAWVYADGAHWNDLGYATGWLRSLRVYELNKEVYTG